MNNVTLRQKQEEEREGEEGKVRLEQVAEMMKLRTWVVEGDVEGDREGIVVRQESVVMIMKQGTGHLTGAMEEVVEEDVAETSLLQQVVLQKTKLITSNRLW